MDEVPICGFCRLGFFMGNQEIAFGEVFPVDFPLRTREREDPGEIDLGISADVDISADFSVNFDD